MASTAIGDSSRDYTWFATDEDLNKYGYVEEEFFVEGKARPFATYSSPKMAKESSEGLPYKTRIVVRRPRMEQSFSGNVLLEWNNVTTGTDIDFIWLESSDYIMRSGHAYVSVSAQNKGVDALKTWSDRYKSLDVAAVAPFEKDALSFGIYSQVAQALRKSENTKLLGGLKVKSIVAAGPSQSGRFLAYYHNSVQQLHQVVDGSRSLHIQPRFSKIQP